VTTYLQGTTATLIVQWREYAPDGPLVDVNNIAIEVVSLVSGLSPVGPTSVGIAHPTTGTYVYNWAIPINQAAESYVVLWTANDVATSGALEASEIITVATAAGGDLGTGVCELWEPTFTCALPTNSEAVTGTALAMATQVLTGLTGYRYGLCQLTIRPCRRACFDGTWPYGGGWLEYGGVGGGPTPALIRGRWYNITCGGCSGECTCGTLEEIALPGPVYDVIEVKVDGLPLTQGVDYRLDNNRLLVRLGDLWPTCNDLNLADTEVGTWSVTLRIGEAVPALGRVAIGVLTTEFTKALICDGTCQLPMNVQSISRQGVDVTFIDPTEVFANRRTGLYIPDLFINSVNPSGLARRSKAYDIDAPFPRRTGT
jgi:hypothetical protein